MKKLGDYYSDFIRIDLDAPGGFARVAETKTNGQKEFPDKCAFKVMRHERESEYEGMVNRFDDEIDLLIKMLPDIQEFPAITRIYDSGFVPVEFSQSLHKRESPDPELEIISTGLNLKEFRDQRPKLDGKWLPYLVVELAPYDDSLLRQINNQPKDDLSGLFRFPTGEIIVMALQLLDVMQYLHTTHGLAYMDWKPEHIYWDGLKKRVKLIDWNVTAKLDENPGRKQNILDDIRIFCGAVLYIGFTFVNPDEPTKPIGPRPTQELALPVPEIRRRYWTDNPTFYQRDKTLDDSIRQIIKKGLDPKQGFDSTEKLKTALLEYAESEFGLRAPELKLETEPQSHYFRALTKVHEAQQMLDQAQKHLYEAVAENGTKLEFTRLFDAIKQALKNFPVS